MVGFRGREREREKREERERLEERKREKEGRERGERGKRERGDTREKGRGEKEREMVEVIFCTEKSGVCLNIWRECFGRKQNCRDDIIGTYTKHAATDIQTFLQITSDQTKRVRGGERERRSKKERGRMRGVRGNRERERGGELEGNRERECER
jgi:hypothetical protein